MRTTTQTEDWKPIVGYERFYEVSNIGRVRTIKTGLIKAQPIHWKGYPVVTLRMPGECKTHRTHRLVATAFISNPLNLPQVNHKNGIKTDNRVDNLEWCDNSANQQHSIATGLRIMPAGLFAPRARIVLHGEFGVFCTVREAAAMSGIHEDSLHRMLGGIQVNKTKFSYA